MKVITINKNYRYNFIHNAILFITTATNYTCRPYEFQFYFVKLNKIHHNKYPAAFIKTKFCDILKAYYLHGEFISYHQNYFKRYKREEKLKVFK